MFEKNDKLLLVARVVTNVLALVQAIGSAVAGIVLSALDMLAVGLPLLLAVPFVTWVAWVFVRLYLSHVCDTKLIRNKLYGVGNDNLRAFLAQTAAPAAPTAYAPPAQANAYAAPTAYAPPAQTGVYAAANGSADFDYTVNNGTVTLTKLKALAPLVIVPEQVDGLPVADLAEGAFPDNVTIEKVSIHAPLTAIRAKMFAKCRNLTEVVLPPTLTAIEDCAFKGCKKLAAIALPPRLNTIGDDAFANCVSLQKILIPRSVQAIGYGAFYGCNRLVIHAEANEKPDAWKQDWNSTGRPVVWGSKGN